MSYQPRSNSNTESNSSYTNSNLTHPLSNRQESHSSNNSAFGTSRETSLPRSSTIRSSNFSDSHNTPNQPNFRVNTVGNNITSTSTRLNLSDIFPDFEGKRSEGAANKEEREIQHLSASSHFISHSAGSSIPRSKIQSGSSSSHTDSQPVVAQKFQEPETFSVPSEPPSNFLKDLPSRSISTPSAPSPSQSTKPPVASNPLSNLSASDFLPGSIVSIHHRISKQPTYSLSIARQLAFHSDL
jgi:hypothetical protein